jgi:hypothetical protein
MLYAIYPKGSDTTVTKPQTGSVCGTTRGTGEVVQQPSSNELTIKRNDGTLQTMAIAGDATIKNDTGPLNARDIQKGQRVTVVVGDDEIASTILVCGN